MVSSAMIGSGLIIRGTSDGFNRIGCCLDGIMVAEKEAIKKAMLDEKGQDKGYFTIGEVTSLLTMLPHTNWTESKVDRVIQEWYDKGRLMERQEIGKYTPV